MQKVTINCVAKHAGVSKKTVSRVLNKEPNVSAATREKVEQAFDELNYRPNPIARNLASNKSNIIGCIYDNPSKSYITRLQSGCLRGCQEKGYNLLIHPCEQRGDALLESIYNLYQTSHMEGLILTPPFSDSQLLMEFLTDKRLPYARVAPGDSEDNSISIRSNDEQAAFEIVEMLIELGHSQIGFITGHREHSSTQQRLAGYQRALESQGLEYKRELVAFGDFSFHSGEEGARQLLDRVPAPTAIFASNDHMAAAVLKVAQQNQLQVPQQLSIAGFDNSPIARHIWPGITTIDQPVEKMAYQAVTKLIEQINQNQIDLDSDVYKAVLPAKLIVRQSTDKITV